METSLYNPILGWLRTGGCSHQTPSCHQCSLSVTTLYLFRLSVQMCLRCVLNRTTVWCAGSKMVAKHCTAPRRASFRLESSSSAGWSPSGSNHDPTHRRTSLEQKERTSPRTYRWLTHRVFLIFNGIQDFPDWVNAWLLHKLVECAVNVWYLSHWFINSFSPRTCKCPQIWQVSSPFLDLCFSSGPPVKPPRKINYPKNSTCLEGHKNNAAMRLSQRAEPRPGWGSCH